MNTQIRGVLFDLGGTLFSYAIRPEMGRPIFDTAQALDITARPADIGRAWGESNAATMEAFAKRDFFLHRDLFQQTLETFAARFERSVSAEVAEQFAQAQRQAVIDYLPIREDALEMLRALKERGLYLSIVSNIDDDYLHPLVEKHGLDDLLDHWTSSEEARSCKPHTAIYHYSLEKAGLGAHEALFVGDSLHHDVAGASAAGIRSARITEPGASTPLTSGLEITAEPDHVIHTLTELVGLIDQLNDA
jgi:2-haloalkanoic acid dehalogenase type II